MKSQTVIPTGLLKFHYCPHFPFSSSLPLRLFSLSLDKRFISRQKDAPIQSPRCSTSISFGDGPEYFISVLKNYSTNLPVLSLLTSLHSRAIKAGFAENGQICAGLFNLYNKCGSLEYALKLFDEMSQRDVLTWTVLLSSCARSGQDELGMQLFSSMLVDGMSPNRFTLSSVFKCCVKNANLIAGKGIHGWMLRNGIEMDTVLQNSIIDFYAKCNSFGSARKVFEMMTEKDSVSWNVMIGAHLQLGDTDGAMKLFRASPSRDVSSWNTFVNGQMQNGSDKTALQFLHLMAKIGPQFNQHTFSIALVLAAKFALLDLGRQLHSKLLRLGMYNDAFIKNSLINMYSKCGKLETSSTIFRDRVQGAQSSQLALCAVGPLAKTISWSSLIAGFVQNGQSKEALVLFYSMLCEGSTIDPFTLTSIVAACADAGMLEQGRQLHACIEKLGHGFDVLLASAVIDMYAKCGSLDDAHKIFYNIESKNVVFWTSMIASHAFHGEGRQAIRVFEMMLENKVKPNEISFIGVLSACSHEGLVEEGYKYFKLMQMSHGIVPTIEHFTCMVDLLGRCGLLDEAKDFIREYNLMHYSVVFKSFISACRVHCDVETAKWASEQLVQIEPHAAGAYVPLSSIYATKREWMKVSKLWSDMKTNGVRKEPGHSWI